MKLKAKILTIVMVLATLISIIGVFAIPASAATPTILYLKPNSNWTSDGAWFSAYFFQTGKTEKWVKMTDANSDGIYEVSVPSGYSNVIFVRNNPASSSLGWSWNQTSDLTVQTNGNDMYTIAEGAWSKGSGSWSKYTVTVAGSFNGWNTTSTPLTISNGIAKATITLPSGKSTFKVVSGGNWLGYNSAMSLDTAVKVSTSGGDISFTASSAGEYVFSYELSTGKLTIHKHSYVYSKISETQHQEVCACGDTKVAENHTETTAATCKTAAYCATCKSNYGTVNASNHDFTGTVKSDGNGTTHSYLCANGCGNYGSETNCSGGTATCTTKATCSVCGQSYGDLAEHSFTEQIQDEAHIKVNGDCQTHNVYWYDCSVCDTSAEGNDDSKYYTGTSYGDHNYVDGKCSLCGNYNHEHIPAEAVIENNQNPSCTVNGSYDSVVYCNVSGCGYEISRDHIVVDALGHKDDNNDHICDNNCGVYQGVHADSATDKDHVCDYGCGAVLEDCSDAAGDKNHDCDICGAKDVTSHSYAPATCTAPQTCSECGATTGEKLDHDMTEATCKAPSTCKLGCGYTEGGLADHIYENGRCTVCKKVNTEDTVTIYFENNWQWPDASVYYWYFDGEENTKIDNAWPGTALSVEVGKNSEGYSIYQVKIPTAAAGVIFNGTGQYGPEQCNDITDFADCRCYYMTYDDKTGTKPAGYYEYHFDSLTDDDHNCDACGKENVTEHVYEYEKTSETQHTKTCNCGDTAAEDHTYEGYTITTNAGCTTNAFETGTCVCGKTHTREIADSKLGHDFNDVIPQQNSTCLATGRVAYKTCKNCDKYFFADATKFAGGAAESSFNALTTAGGFVIAQLDHDYSGDIKADDNGTTHSFKCVNGCNEYGNATAHDYNKEVAEDTYKKTDATCTAQAVYNKSCACGAEGNEPFSAGEKDPTNHSGEQVNGGTADVHTKWNCCGVTVSSNHDFGNWAPVVDTNTHKRTCSCGHSETAEHSYANYVYNENATCIADGTETATCVCGATDTRTKVGSKLGHEFDNYVAYKAPTCTEKGNQAYKQCTRCNIYFLNEAGNYTEGGVLGSALNTFDIAASGHTFDEIGYDAPTCTEAGNEAHKKCTVCNLYFDTEATEDATDGSENNNEYIINALGHKDENTDHVCDNGCEEYQGEHKDANKDHACDYGCSVAIGEHVDTNKDHACDYGCSEAIGEHKDSATDNDHVCDHGCGEVLEECSDKTGDGNHNCDVCGTADVTGHSYANPTCTESSTCTECGATSGAPMGHKFTTNITCDNGCGTKAAAKVGENYYITVAKALETAKTAAVKDLVITIVGENDASTADNFDLLYQSIFDSVILKQENGDKVYYFYDLYTGTRTNNGEFTFDGVNIVVTDQYMFEGNVRLANNSFIKSVTEANCFFYYSVTTVEPGSKLQGVIDDLRGGTVIVDGGRTDGEYNTTPDMQDAIIYIRWSGDSLTVKNGAYVKINSANEVGRLTVSAGTSLNVYDSKVDSYQWIENNGIINVDVNSLITTGKITGSGKIVIDAADYNDSIGQVIDADLSGFTGEIEVINCEDLFATVDGNGRLTFTKAVASIGSDYYLTLKDAFDAVENGETIVLTRDFELSATAVAPAVKFTIDLNGKTVTSADDYVLNSYNQSIICVTRGTDLTINDSIGGGCLDASELLIAINLTRYGDSDTGECAKLTVNAGKYLGGYYAIAGNGSRDNTYIEINDGQFIGDISAIYHPQEGTLVITGGSFVGNGAGGYGGDAIGFLSGSLEISGGTFEGKTLAAVSIENIGGTSGYQEIGTVSITGGTFISADGYDSITSADEGGGRKISFISGGTFNTDLDLALLVDGLALKQDGESYTVVNAVANIDRTGYGYASLADAVAAAQANDVINLLANDTITKTLDISKSLTINTGAFAITSKADVAFNITASNVTFELIGKVIVSDPDAAANARSGGVAVAQTVLTMDDVNDVIAILDAEFELGAGDVIYSGPVDNISLSVRDDYEAALNKKGYVTKDSTTPGMVNVTAKSLYYIGDDGYWYFDDVKTGVLAKGENGESITITSYDKQPVKDGEFVVSHNYVITFSDGTEITINVPVARSIVSVEYNRTEGNKDIYVITYSDGSTSEFTVTNGTDGHSPVITIENGEWCIDGTPTGIKALGKDGKGIKSINKTTDGLVDTYTIIYTDDTEFEFTVTNGRGIVSISLTSTSADGLVDTYTITYNDGTTSTFTVTNGANGINGIQGEKGDDGHTPVITIQNGKWHIDGVDTGMQAQGVKGETGNGISDISKTGIDGLVDTYTITYTDGTTTTFTVTNGAQGAQGIQGIQGVPGKDGHTPVITIGENGNWFIDGADTGVKAEAIKGETGAPGADGEDGDTPYIGENGNWWIDGVDTGVKAEGKDGNDNNKIIIICIGIAALCIITTIVAVATKKFRRPWWILC